MPTSKSDAQRAFEKAMGPRENPLHRHQTQFQPAAFPEQDGGTHQRIEIDVLQPAEHEFAGLARAPELDKELDEVVPAGLGGGASGGARDIEIDSFLGTVRRA